MWSVVLEIDSTGECRLFNTVQALLSPMPVKLFFNRLFSLLRSCRDMSGLRRQDIDDDDDDSKTVKKRGTPPRAALPPKAAPRQPDLPPPSKRAPPDMPPPSMPADKKQRRGSGSGTNKMPLPVVFEEEPEDSQDDSAMEAAGSSGSGGLPRLAHTARWMVGEHWGKPSQVYFRDCKPNFNQELEDQFEKGEDTRDYSWTGGRIAKVFTHDLVHMTQTNKGTGEVKMLRRVLVLQWSYMEQVEE